MEKLLYVHQGTLCSSTGGVSPLWVISFPWSRGQLHPLVHVNRSISKFYGHMKFPVSSQRFITIDMTSYVSYPLSIDNYLQPKFKGGEEGSKLNYFGMPLWTCLIIWRLVIYLDGKYGVWGTRYLWFQVTVYLPVEDRWLWTSRENLKDQRKKSLKTSLIKKGTLLSHFIGQCSIPHSHHLNV